MDGKSRHNYNARKRQNDCGKKSLFQHKNIRLDVVSRKEKIMKKIIQAGRRKFSSDLLLSQSSAHFVDSFQHCIFYQPFLSYPIILNQAPSGSIIAVDATIWANAFLEFDIEKVATILSQRIFNYEEFLTSKVFRDVETLPKLKRNAISKSSKWMMNKKQNPWTYTPETIVPPLSKTEENAVEKAFYKFTIEADKATREFEDFSHFDEEQLIKDLSHFSGENPLLSDGLCNSNSDNNAFPVFKEKKHDEIEYHQVYIHYLRLILNNSTPNPNAQLAVQAVRDLTKLIIPDNRDVFVDAVQFTIARWKQTNKIMKEKNDIVSCAEKLFKKCWEVDFHICKKQFNTFKDICPVKRLAIIRAVAFVRKFRGKNLEDFDSSIPENNLFLTEEEILQIDHELTLKGQNYKKHSFGEINYDHGEFNFCAQSSQNNQSTQTNNSFLEINATPTTFRENNLSQKSNNQALSNNDGKTVEDELVQAFRNLNSSTDSNPCELPSSIIESTTMVTNSNSATTSTAVLIVDLVTGVSKTVEAKMVLIHNNVGGTVLVPVIYCHNLESLTTSISFTLLK